MNEELQQALLSIINNTTTFVGEQAPLVIQELLAWKLAANLAWLILNPLIGFVAYKVWRHTYSLTKSDDKSWAKDRDGLSGFAVTAFGFSGFWMLVAFICTLESAETALKVAIAPKVYLIEYAAELTKSEK